MFQRSSGFDAYYLPVHLGMDDHEALGFGLAWLKAQPGGSLIMLSGKSQSRKTPELERVDQWATVVTPQSKNRPIQWSGAALVAWAHGPSLRAIAKVRGVHSVCAFGLDEVEMTTWIGGHAARDLREPGRPTSSPQLHPVVQVAMEEMTSLINLNNELTSPEEKAYFVRTLQVLRDGGYAPDIASLSAWAVNNGWGEDVLPRLRELAEGVRGGRQFRLTDPWGPEASDLASWVSKAERG